LKTDGLPQTHIGLTRRTWGWIRKGLVQCMKSPEDCQRCIEWCRTFPDHTHRWIEILQGGHKDMTAAVLETEDFFELSPDAMSWWEQIVQNHPFAVIFAKERYAAMLEKRKNKSHKHHYTPLP
jgi:anti-sigma factor ChrR (cupin superfamily)